MAINLKAHHPDIAFGGAKVGADEVDFYHTYHINCPSVNATAVATAAVIATTVTLVENLSALMDCPRNLRLQLAGGTTSGTYGGTIVVTGLDQFGNAISETFSVATAVNGGNAIGTKVFAKFTAGTGTLAGDTAIATANLGYGTAGTTTLYGLPFKIGGTGDIVNIAWATSHVIHPIKSNRLGSLVNVGMHAVCGPVDNAGTALGVIWAKSTYDQTNDNSVVTGR